MKKLALLLAFTLTAAIGEAQSALETTFLTALNKYRQNKGLVQVYYNAPASVIAKNQAVYLDKCTEAKHNVHGDSDKGHDQKYDVPGFKEMTLEQRAATVKGVDFVGEICFQAFEVKSETDEKLVAADIIKGFDGSPGHKAIMTFDYPNDPSVKPVIGLSVIKKPSSMPGFDLYIVVVDFGFINIP